VTLILAGVNARQSLATPLKRATGEKIGDRITLFAAAAEAASTGEERTQTSPEIGPQITRSRTIEICGLAQPHVFEFKALERPCHS
jgi:hypothetical protein